MHALHGKVILVTGASSGIGRAAALRFAALGARVALAARTAPALDDIVQQVAAKGGEALAIPTDVAERAQCERAVATTVERFGRLDILLCCAGVSMRGPFGDSDLDALDRLMHVNFFGAMHSGFFALPHLKESRGSFVAVTSLTGKRGVPYYAMYGASKFALQGLMESLRVELSPFGIHVGVVAPGFVDTPLREHVLQPDGQLHTTPPWTPFRIWPVERCVDLIVELIVRRQGERLLPWLVRPLLTLDAALGGRLGDLWLGRKFGCRKPRE